MFGNAILIPAKIRHSIAVRALVFSAFAPLVAAYTPAAHAQGRGGGATVVVNVVGTDGGPISQSAEVSVGSAGDEGGTTQYTGSNGMASFARMPRGDYSITVHAPGYKDGSGSVEVASVVGTFEATVTLQRELLNEPNEKGFSLAPKARKELDAGVAAMRLKNYDEAQKHFEIAFKLAPANPEVNDRFGELFLFTHDLARAQDYLQRAVSLDPDDQNILTDIGQLRISQGDFVNAQVSLEKATTLAPDNWFAHWMLGVAYLRVQENEKARTEALAAIKYGKGGADEARYLLGEALAALGRKSEAIDALQGFVKNSPKNSYVPAAQTLIAKLQSSDVTPPVTPAAPSSNFLEIER
jgi:Flp pilus assembly protein TadD